MELYGSIEGVGCIMGVIRRYQCPSCKKTWELFVGHGMKHGILGRVMGTFPKDIQKKIAVEVQGEQLPLVDFQYEEALCKNCQELVAVPVLRFMERQKTFLGKCPNCGSETERLNLQEGSEADCPGCGGYLKIQDTGHWD